MRIDWKRWRCDFFGCDLSGVVCRRCGADPYFGAYPWGRLEPLFVLARRIGELMGGRRCDNCRRRLWPWRFYGGYTCSRRCYDEIPF